MPKPRPDSPLRYWTDAGEGVSAPVYRPVCVVGQVDVATVEYPKFRKKVIVDLLPCETITVTAREISEDPCVAWISFCCTGIQLRGAAHLKPGHIRDRDIMLPCDSEQQLSW